MARRMLQQTAKMAKTVGPFDEYPVIPDGISPQLMMSRNDRPQPFYLICEKDTLLVQMSGVGRVEFKDSAMNFTPTSPGDMIYVPARTPHRTVSNEDSIIYRYKAEQAGLEGVAWYCENCGSEVHRLVFDTATELPQEGYSRAVEAFNRDETLRTCGTCNTVHPTVDASGNNWAAIAKELRSADDDEDDDDDW